MLWAGSRGRSECDRTGRYGMMARMAKSAGRSAWYRDPCVSLVNTVDQGWFVGADAGLIGADGIHPTDGGHEYMEGKVEADLAQLGFIAAAPPA